MKRFTKILIVFIIVCSTVAFSQQREKEALKLLDKVKTIYGNPCEVGVGSSLMKELYEYKDVYQVNDYINQFEKIRNLLYDNTSALKYSTWSGGFPVSMNGLYGREKNIINACGIFYGADEVNATLVTYSVVRNEISNYYQDKFIFKDFDQTVKDEFMRYDENWFTALALTGLKK